MHLLRISPIRMVEAAGLSLPTCGLLCLSVFAALSLQGLTGVWIRIPHFQWLAPVSMLAGVICLSAGSSCRPRFNAAVTLSAVLTIQLPVTCALAYGVQSFGLPLRDDLFVGIDRAFGFDWMMVQSFMVEKDVVMAILSLAYDTFFLQLSAAPVILAILGEIRRADRFVASFILCVLITVAVSALLPAEGAAGLVGSDKAHLLVQGATPLAELHALREGTLRIVRLEEVGPVISFPSLHCAVAYLVTAAFWPLERLRWPVVLLNAVMTVSAVTHGAHYACDCVAGLLAAAVSFHAAGRLSRGRARILSPMRGAALPPAVSAALVS